ncbi:hypothetical protein ASD78_16745 [Lysobacter sp. Root667]|uniref:XVIPCD domain-containing protein n=1 Tax=Lysobacter sp. Root667 TaxID=1736581 RepID=UPI0006F66AAA|nr:XVIPCD domain-containing protein [Lysobacter sp. Root667]KRA72011.1 hypothetical protein ASD78_16745 [Lysobacter sp. Root667]
MPKDYENPLNPDNHQTPWEAARKPRDATQFYDQVGSGTKALTAVPMDLLRANTATFFRSDDRPTAEIFRDGFAPRDGQGIVYRLMKQDIHPHTAVCMTGTMEAASLFPIKVDRTRADFDPSQKEAPEETRVYVIAPKALFNTHDIQARFAARVVRDQGAEQLTMAADNLFGLERAAPRIAPEDVIGAFTVRRTWAGRDYLAGGTFEVTDYTPNPGALAHTDKQEALRRAYPAHTAGNLALKADVPGSTTRLVARYVKDGNVAAEAPDPVLGPTVSGPISESQARAQEAVRTTRAAQVEVWNTWKRGVSNPEQGIAADTPVTVRKIDDRSAFLAEIEKFELRMGKTDERSAIARKKHFDEGEHAPGAEQYVAYKNDVPVGWMTLDTSAGVRIDKICTDAKPAHDEGVGTKLLVEAVGASRRHGGGGTVSMAGSDTLKYASTDGGLYARMGINDVGGRSELVLPSPELGIAADTPVMVRKIDDRSAFLAEIEKFELRMGKTDEPGAIARWRHSKEGDNTPGTEQYVAYKNDVPVGWMTLDTSAGARIDKICTDAKPAHDAGVGTQLMVEAVGASLRHGGNGTVSMAGPDTLKYASTDGSLYARMGCHDAGGRSELFPSNHVDRGADGAPTHPYWESTRVPLGTFTKRGGEQFGERIAYVQDAGHRLEPTAAPQLAAPERPKLFNDAMTAINRLGTVKGLDSDYDRACMAASLAASAHASRMTQIDTVTPGTKGNLIAVQGDPTSPARQMVSATIGLGAGTPLDDSLARLDRPLSPNVATPEPGARDVGMGGR